MASFEIDAPEIDIEALEARVHEAIERKRGVRFTDEELQALRNLRLEPRLRREDLPRGVLQEITATHCQLPDVAPPPGIQVSPAMALYESGRSGVYGMLLRALRRLTRPFYRATLNLESVLAAMVRPANAHASWTTKQFSALSGALSDQLDQLDRWRERNLHLLHNLVYELTNVSLELQQMQDRINELTRRLDMLSEREGALEHLALGEKKQTATSKVPGGKGRTTA
ncbi:MAG: hypothetical protein ACE5HV_05130 [Acidobacteriota bacterium]